MTACFAPGQLLFSPRARCNPGVSPQIWHLSPATSIRPIFMLKCQKVTASRSDSSGCKHTKTKTPHPPKHTVSHRSSQSSRHTWRTRASRVPPEILHDSSRPKKTVSQRKGHRKTSLVRLEMSKKQSAARGFLLTRDKYNPFYEAKECGEQCADRMFSLALAQARSIEQLWIQVVEGSPSDTSDRHLLLGA